METLILSGDNKSEMKMIAGLARKLGLKTRKLKLTEIEDIALLRAMQTAETQEYIDTDQFLDSLKKK
jgi:hypothetical protein